MRFMTDYNPIASVLFISGYSHNSSILFGTQDDMGCFGIKLVEMFAAAFIGAVF